MKEKDIYELEEMAIEGDAEAARELVRRYRTGDGVEIDYDAAEIWEKYSRQEDSIEQGSITFPGNDELNPKKEKEAEFEAGDEFLFKGSDSTIVDISEIEEAAIGGDENAIRELVRRYSEGDGVSKDLDAAGKWASCLESVNKSEEDSFENDYYENSSNGSDDEVIKKKELSFSLSYEEYQQLDSFRLRQMCDSGDAVAKIVLGERYVHANTENEEDEGIGLLKAGIEELKRILTEDNDSSDYCIELIVCGYKILGKQFLLRHKKLNSKYWMPNLDDTYANDIFNCYSNIFELTEEITEELIECYREGLGVERNEKYADKLQMKRAEEGGAEVRAEYADLCLSKGQTIKASEWFQAVFAANDARLHPATTCYASIRILEINNVHDNAEQVALKKNELCKLSEAGDDEAWKYLSKINDDRQDTKIISTEELQSEEEFEIQSLPKRLFINHRIVCIVAIGIITFIIGLIMYSCTKSVDVTVSNNGENVFFVKWSDKKNNYVIEKSSNEKNLHFKSTDRVSEKAKEYIEAHTKMRVLVNGEKAKKGIIVHRDDRVEEIPDYIDSDEEENVEEKFDVDLSFKSNKIRFPKKYVSAKEVLKDKRDFFKDLDSKAERAAESTNGSKEFYLYYRGLMKNNVGGSDCLLIGFVFGEPKNSYLRYTIIDDFDANTSIDVTSIDLLTLLLEGASTEKNTKALKESALKYTKGNYRIIDLSLWNGKKKKTVDVY